MSVELVPVRADITTVINGPKGVSESTSYVMRRSASQAQVRREHLLQTQRPQTSSFQPVDIKTMHNLQRGMDLGIPDGPTVSELQRWSHRSVASLIAPPPALLPQLPHFQYDVTGQMRQPRPRTTERLDSTQRSIALNYHPLANRLAAIAKPSPPPPRWTANERILQHLRGATGSTGGERPPPSSLSQSLDQDGGALHRGEAYYFSALDEVFSRAPRRVGATTAYQAMTRAQLGRSLSHSGRLSGASFRVKN